MGQISRIFDQIIYFGIILGAGILFFDTLSVNAEIISRFLVGKSFIWVVEITEISLLFITFLGVAWVLKKDGHVSVDILLSKLSIKHQAIFNAVTSIIGAIVIFPLVWYGTKVAWIHYQKDLYDATALNIPDVAILFVIPLGSVLLFIQLLRRAYEYFNKWKTK